MASHFERKIATALLLTIMPQSLAVLSIHLDQHTLCDSQHEPPGPASHRSQAESRLHSHSGIDCAVLTGYNA